MIIFGLDFKFGNGDSPKVVLVLKVNKKDVIKFHRFFVKKFTAAAFLCTSRRVSMKEPLNAQNTDRT
jgi:hypothetical protein